MGSVATIHDVNWDAERDCESARVRAKSSVFPFQETDLMIRVVCACGRVFKAEDRHAGKRTKCPVCGAMLTIGQTPVTSSSGGDMDEVPSWWYPSDPQGQIDGSGLPPRSGSDPETIRTAILPPGADPKVA